MRIEVYKCDFCEKVLSSDKEKKEHIHVDLNQSQVGIAKCDKGYWNVTKKLPCKILQFCNLKCFFSWITKKFNGEKDGKKSNT